MKNNTTLPLGSISIIDKIEKDFGLISGIFGKAGGKTRNFVGTLKVKDTIVENGLHYLTLKAKKISTYTNFIKDFDKRKRFLGFERFNCFIFGQAVLVKNNH
ncbi:MAG: hypothetical protein M1168_02765 [Candidatus Marsarchaeota archaeon]|nr:hypothetical protein [Candidatus Marsarchaeota archaeon]